MWKTCNIQSLGKYHNLYVKTDILLLADLFQNFISLCHKYYNMDVCHVFAFLWLFLQPCLKMCDFQLELLTDINMLMFIGESVSSVVSQISHRLATANIPPHLITTRKNIQLHYLLGYWQHLWMGYVSFFATWRLWMAECYPVQPWLYTIHERWVA